MQVSENGLRRASRPADATSRERQLPGMRVRCSLLPDHVLGPSGVSPCSGRQRAGTRRLRCATGATWHTATSCASKAPHIPKDQILGFTTHDSQSNVQASNNCATCGPALRVAGPAGYMRCSLHNHTAPTSSSASETATLHGVTRRSVLIRSLAHFVQPSRQLLPYVIHQLLYGLYDSLHQPRAIQLPVALAVVRAPAWPPTGGRGIKARTRYVRE